MCPFPTTPNLPVSQSGRAATTTITSLGWGGCPSSCGTLFHLTQTQKGGRTDGPEKESSPGRFLLLRSFLRTSEPPLPCRERRKVLVRLPSRPPTPTHFPPPIPFVSLSLSLFLPVPALSFFLSQRGVEPRVCFSLDTWGWGGGKTGDRTCPPPPRRPQKTPALKNTRFLKSKKGVLNYFSSGLLFFSS